MVPTETNACLMLSKTETEHPLCPVTDVDNRRMCPFALVWPWITGQTFLFIQAITRDNGTTLSR